jgi:hypothetical protein
MLDLLAANDPRDWLLLSDVLALWPSHLDEEQNTALLHYLIALTKASSNAKALRSR